MVTPTELLAARRGYVIAAAGCGKTESIAESVAQAEQRCLVLTHTHAGVGVLRQRLRTKGATRRARVETITGFALRYAAAYRNTSGWDDDKPSAEQWNAVQEAARRVLDTRTGKSVLRASYPGGVFVDEYQDCTGEQHDLVLAIAEALPTRLLGDPLQGIFGFAGRKLDWKLVKNQFEQVGELVTPHRWRNFNPELGDWLVDARTKLEAQEEPRWSASVVTTGESTIANQVLACGRFRDRDSVVAIRKWPKDERLVASRLGGAFTSMETIDSKELFEAARLIDGSQGSQLALVTYAIGDLCMTRVGTVLKSAAARLRKGELPSLRVGASTAPAVEALRRVAVEGVTAVPDALDRFAELPQVRIYRHEFLQEVKRAARSRMPSSGRSFVDVIWDLREEARRQGTQVPTRVVSRTLLVKGLEFDHAIVLDRNELNREELYVAITRPRRSLTVLV